MKRLAKETAVYGLSSIIGRFLNWLLVPMYVRVLADTADFGIYTNLYAWVALLLVIITFGMETGMFRFINNRDEAHPDRVYAASLYFVAALSVAFAAFAIIGLPWLSSTLNYQNNPEYLAMMAGVVSVDAVCSIAFAYLRYKGKAIRFAGLKMLSIMLNIFLNVFFFLICPFMEERLPGSTAWFYAEDYGVGYIFISNMITTAVTFGILISDMLPGLKAWRQIDISLWRRMLSYSFPILILGVAGIFNQTADKILFPFLFEDQNYANEQLGIYGACFKIAVVMVMFTHSFRYAYEPYVFSRNRDKGNKEAYADAMKYFIIASLAIFLFVMFYLDFLKYFVSPAYYPGLRVVPIVMLGELFYGIYYNLSIWYKLTDNTRWGAWFSLTGCFSTVAVILLMAPKWGYMACAWASPVCNGLMMTMSYFVGRKRFPVPYNLGRVATYTVLAASFYLLGMYIEIGDGGIKIAYRTGLLVAFAAIASGIEIKAFKSSKKF